MNDHHFLVKVRVRHLVNLCVWPPVGELAVEWDVQKVGDVGRGVQTENWVEPSQPRDDKEKLQDLIIREGLLQLQPSEGILQPGQSTTCLVTYRYGENGREKLKRGIQNKVGLIKPGSFCTHRCCQVWRGMQKLQELSMRDNCHSYSFARACDAGSLVCCSAKWIWVGTSIMWCCTEAC